MRRIITISLMITVVVAIYGVAVAGTVLVTKQTHSLEGLNGVTAEQTSNSITYTLAAAYAVGDLITFTFSPDALAAASYPSQINILAVDSPAPANAIAGLGLGLLSASANSITYRIMSISQPDDTPGDGGTSYTEQTTVGAQVTLGTIGYTAASMSVGTVTVTVSSETSIGDVLDLSGMHTGTIGEAITQFGTVTVSTPFDGFIDVFANRESFTTGTSDTLTWSVETPDTTGWLNLINFNTSDGTVVTLSGEASRMSGLTIGNFTSSGGTLSFDDSSATLTVSYDGQENSGTITFTPPIGAEAVILEAQAFTIDVVHNYISAASVAGSKTIAADLAAGVWGFNGATCIIPYMPYSASASQVMYVTNIGPQSGDIIVEAIDESGKLYELGVIGVAQSNKITKIATFISDALLANGFDGGKLAIKIHVNAPPEDIYVHAAYVAGTARGHIEVEYVNR
ncbi:MAG: hypothetical protein GY702_21935 [Desulfobulbaceae bacterium]|nr:hypothetical protein [Desulfobulbaceae bacterium]